jgi:hypothetical protein
MAAYVAGEAQLNRNILLPLILLRHIHHLPHITMSWPSILDLLHRSVNRPLESQSAKPRSDLGFYSEGNCAAGFAVDCAVRIWKHEGLCLTDLGGTQNALLQASNRKHTASFFNTYLLNLLDLATPTHQQLTMDPK